MMQQLNPPLDQANERKPRDPQAPPVVVEPPAFGDDVYDPRSEPELFPMPEKERLPDATRVDNRES